MRFMMIVKGNKDYEAGMPPPPALMAAVARMAEEAAREGSLLSNGALLPSSAGVRVRVERGRMSVTDGPFGEAKELVGGFAIFELPSKAAAIEAGRRFMQVHADILGPTWEGELEIRPMMDGSPQECRDVR
jgi:hypothetical protein